MSLLDAAVVVLLTAMAPVLARSLPRAVAVPGVVVEIVVGLVAGPHGLGLFGIDAAVSTLALLGVTFLFFLAGLEIDLRQIRGRLLARSLAAYAGSLGLAALAMGALSAGGLLDEPLLVAVAFSATGLGLVIPILSDAGLLRSVHGAVLLAMASVAEFGAVILLVVGFSADGSPPVDAVVLVALAVLAVAVTLAGGTAPVRYPG